MKRSGITLAGLLTAAIILGAIGVSALGQTTWTVTLTGPNGGEWVYTVSADTASEAKDEAWAEHRALFTAVAVPDGPPNGDIPSHWRRSASFESTSMAGTDGWHIDSPFDVTRTDEVGGSAGDYAEKIVTNGGNQDCSCARMKFEDGFSFGPGDDVWISGSWLIPNPMKLSWSRLMNLGHFEESGSNRNWYLALESTIPGTMQVGFAPYDNPHVGILPARPIPADRWFRVDLHFHLSPTDGQALTEWYIDSRLVGSTTNANMLNSDPLHFYNAGLPYFGPWNGDTTVYFDAPRLTP